VPILLTYFVDRAFLVIAGPIWGIAIPAVSVLLAIWFRRVGPSLARRKWAHRMPITIGQVA
jgi:hypothetical protein